MNRLVHGLDSCFMVDTSSVIIYINMKQNIKCYMVINFFSTLSLSNMSSTEPVDYYLMYKFYIV